jgi:hypothetical protein
MQHPKPAAIPRAPQALIEQIIRDALRGAATAPTIYEALDIAGFALSVVAQLLRTEEAAQ